MNLKRHLLLATALLVSACNATSNTSFRSQNFPTNRDSAILIDAKQRAILSAVWQEASQDTAKITRFCAEPSPDFVSVMAQALSAGGTFGKTADPASFEAALNLAYSRSENGTTIARTQTINMLRELMYRTCERFLSGGYDEMELSIQAVRDQRLMVSILAIEQLTGAVAPTPVVIMAGGSAGAGLGGEAIKTYDKLRDQKKAAETAEQAAQAAYDKDWKKKDDGTDNVCTVNAGKFGEGKTPTEDDKKEKKRCDGLTSNLASAKANTAQATKDFTTVEQAMTTGGVSASTVTEAIANGGLSRATTQATSEVADTVEKIVEMNFNDQTETMLFCLRAIRKADEFNLPEPNKTALLKRCFEYLDKDIKLAIAELQFRTDTIQGFNDDTFNLLWRKVAKDGGEDVDSGKMKTLLDALFPPTARKDLSAATQNAIQAMLVAKNVSEARDAFGLFTQPDRTKLAGS